MNLNMNVKLKFSLPKPQDEICISDSFNWALNGIELREKDMLDLKIGGHWIYGVLINTDHGLIWSSWVDFVSVPIVTGLKARWSKERQPCA